MACFVVGHLVLFLNLNLLCHCTCLLSQHIMNTLEMSHETILVLEEGLALATHGTLSRRPGMACVVLGQLLIGGPDCAILTAWPVAFDPGKVVRPSNVFRNWALSTRI